jgi:glycosyltransferase involved in cell wall biosynthesis
MCKDICIIYGGFKDGPGGVTSHLRRLTSGLKRLSINSRLISLDNLPITRRYAGHLYQKIWNTTVFPLGYKKRMLFNSVGLNKLVRRINTKKMFCIYEDVFTANYMKYSGIAILHALMSDNLNGAYTHPNRLEELKRYEAECLMSVSGRVVCVSEAYRNHVLDSLSSYLDCEPDIDVIPLGIDDSIMPRPRERAKDDGVIRAIAVGVINGRKNFCFLAEILKEARKLKLPFDLGVVGDGPDRNKLRVKLENACGNEQKVKFYGWLDEKSLWNVMSEYNIMLHPSTVESFSLTLLEAKAMGLSTIATAGLDIPAEFCDIALELDASLWISNLLYIKSKDTNNNVERIISKYNNLTMVKSYLDKLNGM